MKTKTIIFILLILFVLAVCKPDKSTTNNSAAPANDTVLLYSQNSVADTIVYDVIVKNPNPEDKWTDECLKNLEKDTLVAHIFRALYMEKLKAYDFFSGEQLSVNDIKQLENDKEFDRKNIGKLQFVEAWYFDTEKMQMVKKVISVSIGYETFTKMGELMGYKPGFKVYMN